MRQAIRFYLNDELVTLAALTPERTLLDFLRLDRVLRGTKEGCAEGDCGACTVLVGRLRGDEVVYEAINACIGFVGALDGCHVVTIEHLAREGCLHPVQQAMVDHHASQCGFCTPGIVMSLYGLWLEAPEAGEAEIERTLQGNLCRCTGYAPIVRAALAVSRYGDVAADPLRVGRERIARQLAALRDGERAELGEDARRIVVPADLDDLAATLLAEPEATIVAGATDVGLWVTKFMREMSPLVFVSHIEALRRIEITDRAITFGAAVTYSEAAKVVAIRLPWLSELWDRIGGAQVRNMGTLGGNIANGSPIGDTPPPFIVLGAEIVLRKGDARRVLKLEDFFIDYGRQDRKEGEFLESIAVPLPGPDEQVAAYKVSKRRDEDISALLGAFRIRCVEGRVEQAVIAYGGMAGVPKRARAVEAALQGKPWTRETVEAALPAFETDYQPLSDWRASAAYRMLAAKNLLRRFFLETTGAAETRLAQNRVA